MASYVDSTRVFKAFAEEKRLMILELLQSGEKCACVLIDKMGISQSCLSYHMKILCESGIVEGRVDGKWTHYSINPQGSKFASQLVLELTALDNQPS